MRCPCVRRLITKTIYYMLTTTRTMHNNIVPRTHNNNNTIRGFIRPSRAANIYIIRVCIFSRNAARAVDRILSAVIFVRYRARPRCIGTTCINIRAQPLWKNIGEPTVHANSISDRCVRLYNIWEGWRTFLTPSARIFQVCENFSRKKFLFS